MRRNKTASRRREPAGKTGRLFFCFNNPPFSRKKAYPSIRLFSVSGSKTLGPQTSAVLR